MRGGRQFRLAILDIGVNRVFVRGYIWCVNARSIFRVENDLLYRRGWFFVRFWG